jgi:uncharacterized membrane protein YhhN
MVAGILTLLSVVSGVTYIWAAYYGTQAQRYVFKPLTTVLILGVALSVSDPISSLYRILIALGLIFSLGGDIFLMLPNPGTFVFGLVSFLIAHLLYIAGYTSRGGFRFTWWLFLLYALYVAGMLWLLWPHVGSLRIPVIVYAAVLGIMGWQAAELWWAVRDTSALLAMIGALLFLISDTALALNKFRAPLPNRDLIIMSTYYAAQLLIAWSVHRFAKPI